MRSSTPRRARFARTARSPLPPEDTAFIGRRRELAAVQRAYAEGHRLVTLLGLAGAGKTRLAARYAGVEAAAKPSRRIRFCDLTEARTLEDVCGCLARALDLPLSRDAAKDAVNRIGRALAARRDVLVVLDNFEQLVDVAATAVGAWIAASSARFLVTSRERLRLPSEVCLDIGPLPIPASDETDPRAIASCESVQLFIERVKMIDGGFQPGRSDVPTIAAIVRKLEGFPLALELAAARMRSLGSAELLGLLSNRFDVLTSRLRGAHPRHATLRGAIDWSWTLLDATEQRVLARCSVFRGGFTRAAAAAVVGDPRTVDVLDALHDKSLLRALAPSHAGSEARFAMYESIREYASEKLGDGEEAADARARHADYFLAPARAIGAGQGGGREEPARVREARRAWLEVEMDNILAVHERALGVEPPTADALARAIAAASLLERSFLTRGPIDRFMTLMDDALRFAERIGDPPPQLVAKALVARAGAAANAGDYVQTIRFGERALELLRSERDPDPHPDVEVRALLHLALVHSGRGSRQQASACFGAASALLDQHPDDELMATLLYARGRSHEHELRFADARADFRAAIELFRKVGLRAEEGVALASIGVQCMAEGALAQARAHLDDAIDALREGGDRRFEGEVLGFIGLIDQELGDYPRARRLTEQSMMVARAIGNRRWEGVCRLTLGGLAMEERRLDEARARLGEAISILAEMGDARQLGCARALFAGTEALQGRPTEARREFDDAEAIVREAGRPSDRAIVTLVRGCLGAPVALDAPGADRTSALEYRRQAIDLARALERAAEGGETPSWEVRFAARLFRKLEGTSPHAAPTSVAIVVEASGAWFRRDGVRVDIGHRRPLRAILARLAHTRLLSPDQPVSSQALIEAAWPGEAMDARSASMRLRVAVHTLRKLGLADGLVWSKTGYQFASSVGIELAERLDPDEPS